MMPSLFRQEQHVSFLAPELLLAILFDFLFVYLASASVDQIECRNATFCGLQQIKPNRKAHCGLHFPWWPHLSRWGSTQLPSNDDSRSAINK